jgi:hypothetical protein
MNQICRFGGFFFGFACCSGQERRKERYFFGIAGYHGFWRGMISKMSDFIGRFCGCVKKGMTTGG